MKFSMSLRYTLGRLFLNFIKVEWVMTSLWRHLRLLQAIVHISSSVEPTNFVLGTNAQQHNVHSMIKMRFTLTDDEGHRRRSNVTKMNYWSYLANYYTHRHHTWYNTISDIKWHKRFWLQGQRSHTCRCLRSLNVSCCCWFISSLHLEDNFFINSIFNLCHGLQVLNDQGDCWLSPALPPFLQEVAEFSVNIWIIPMLTR